MKQRPLAVFLIAWFVIVISGFDLMLTTITFTKAFDPRVMELLSSSSVSLPVQMLIAYFKLGAMLASGLGMLKGWNWGRLLYVALTVVLSLHSAVTLPVTWLLIPGVVMNLVVFWLLFQPAANRFFAAKGSFTGMPEHARKSEHSV